MRAYRIVAAILGVLFLVQGLNWIIDPQSAAEGLAMPLLEGAARSTQVGDFASFFVALGLMVLNGTRPGHAGSLYGGVLLLGGAAIFRTLAWLLHDAAFAAPTIAIEVVCAVFLIVAARQLSPEGRAQG